MDEQTFEQLASEAATGLKADRELYLEVTQELVTHLEARADKLRAQGQSEEESIAGAKRAFGSPLEMAADLLEANRARMKWHALARLAFAALVVPLAILLALYVGYGRFARAAAIGQHLDAFQSHLRPPQLPFFSVDAVNFQQQSAVLRALRGGNGNAEAMRAYWEAHRHEPNAHIYYAHYALFVEGKRENDNEYLEAMRQGERIEPDNALYNVLLARYYLRRGMIARQERPPDDPETDELLDRRRFELGLAEFRKAVAKPYLRTYQPEVLRIKLNALPAPRFTEDYLQQIAVMASIYFPHYAQYRTLARKIPGCARLLIAEGRQAEAETLMDAWRPFTLLLHGDSEMILIASLVTKAVGNILAHEGAEVYDLLGAHDRAREARAIDTRLRQVHETWRSSKRGTEAKAQLRRYGARMVGGIFFPVFGGVVPTEAELTPGRMHEHVIMEEVAVQVLLGLLALALLGTLLQSAIWFYRARKGAASAPLLLLPPAKVTARALLLGIALPLLLYWLYSRAPVLGGREFGWGSEMMPRFVAELLVLLAVMLWAPMWIVRRYLRRRCEELSIAMPAPREERAVTWKMRAGIFLALALLAVSSYTPYDFDPLLRVISVLLALGLLVIVLGRTGGKRAAHGHYYGTLARSMATIYAFAILFLAVVAQPFLLAQEAYWLRKDTAIFGYVNDRSGSAAGFTLVETRAAAAYNQLVRDALDGR